jgi:hypothetical protein
MRKSLPFGEGFRVGLTSGKGLGWGKKNQPLSWFKYNKLNVLDNYFI